MNFQLLLLLLAYLIVGALYGVRTPDWQAPDEPAHYNYVAQIVRSGCCPVIELGDWGKAYLDRLTTNEFAPELLDELDTLQYEDHQPPLYYIFASIVFRLTNGSLVALRLFSVVIGLGVIAVAYTVARALLSPPVALAAAAFVAFVPQHLAMLAAVNNDSLSELIIGLTLLATIYYLRGNSSSFLHGLTSKTWVLGALVGVGLLTKINTAFLVGITPLMIVLHWWSRRPASDVPPLQRQNTRHLLRSLILFIIPVLLLAGIWWVRNLTIYGSPDFLGLGRHDLVVADQPRTADQIAMVGVGEYLRASLERTFVSFWGQFGWMALPLNGWMLWLVISFLALVLSGWVIRWVVRRASPDPHAEGWRGLAWALLALAVVATLAQYVYYNTEFYQMQGRYLFPMLIPLGLWTAAGLDGWRRFIFRQWESAQWLTVVPVLVFLPLNLYVVWRVIPSLAPGN